MIYYNVFVMKTAIITYIIRYIVQVSESEHVYGECCGECCGGEAMKLKLRRLWHSCTECGNVDTERKTYAFVCMCVCGGGLVFCSDSWHLYLLKYFIEVISNTSILAVK